MAVAPGLSVPALPQGNVPAPPPALSPEDDTFLDELEKANFQFFWEQADPQTGLVKDRCHVRETDNTIVASIASTGMGLTALCIAQKRGYVSFQDARNRVLTTLRFLWKSMPNHHGFYYHFANIQNRRKTSGNQKISSIDTAMLICGVLTCRQHFQQRPNHPNLRYEIFMIAWNGPGSRRTPALLAAWLGTGVRLPALSLGLLQRTDDDVPARSRLFFPPSSRGVVERLEAHYL